MASDALAQSSTLTQEPIVPYIISFKTSIDYHLVSKFEGKILQEYQNIPAVVVEISESNVLNLKNSSSQVEFIEPDLKINVVSDVNSLPEPHLMSKVTSQPLILSESTSTQTIPWGIEKVNALEVQKKGFTGKNIKIGIIDSGVDYTHDDLYVTGGISFVKGSPDYMDDFGHGTAVAGIIGAKNNSIGVVGAAPDSQLFAIKVLDSKGDGYVSDVVSGIDWSIKSNMNIVNLSLTTTTDSKTLKKAVKEAYRKGVLLISAAGNIGFNEGDTITYPAAYKEVIAVGAINSRNERTFYSSSGKDLELMAPGASIYSTSPNDQYSMNLGTSMASPHVTGVAAQIWEATPHLKNKDIREILDNTATKMGEKASYGYGLIDALNALNYTKK
ncbi:S8 family peptidase [Paenibacillus chondroitinus]|uniref:S8 family peptidase n=1 Tax=Paenibacillus chondroitinus TaxID=59842 RepID=A0ABU6DIM7_9BACL|nr:MULTISPECIES: S8 family peptidase [Paenibacillus]MCY9657616.1 S8 family peptidase [Paenibacillus anseongense]MEB4797401.1 S8 family peptidase [Paenibacillus chondroitinus]